MYSNKFCDAVGCSIEDDKDIRITCRGYCKGLFHSCCISIPRAWQASSLRKVIMTNYICDKCICMPDMILQFDEIWSQKFHDLRMEVNRMHDHSTKMVEDNTRAFNELSESMKLDCPTQATLEDVQKKVDAINMDVKVLLVSVPTSNFSRDQNVDKSHSNIERDTDNWRTLGNKRVWKASWVVHDGRKDKKRKQRRERRRRSRKQDKSNTVGVINNQDPNCNSLQNSLIHQMPPTVQKGMRNYMLKY